LPNTYKACPRLSARIRPYCEATIFTVVLWCGIGRDFFAGLVGGAPIDDDGVLVAVELETGVETEV
jgi:hypothetical protein